MRPDGACALVTGGTRGIGAAIAEALKADGWNVAVVSRSSGMDVTDPEAVERGFAEIEQMHGPVLCLVNNAGITADNLALSLQDDEWDRVLDTNLTGAFRLTRRAMRPMLRARFGRIVNIASVVGPRANAGQANYAASKAGLIGLTKTVAAEVARKGVTVNAVAPGFIDTDMTHDIPDAVKQAVPARRAGTPQEVAAAVRFLASDDAGYVTGSTLYVDGGLAA
jgi:NAD(P)-dependent dehydrogenase (short-subunit alcohol dehydrogenase family)